MRLTPPRHGADLPSAAGPVVRRVFALAVLATALASAAPRTVEAQDLGIAEATIEDLNRAFESGSLTAERLIEMHLARIEAYDQGGPRLNAVLHVNPDALETARALDRERRERGPRSPLHGIPVVLKDNVDTYDMPTTGGSILLAGSIPPDDAFIVERLREAGATVVDVRYPRWLLDVKGDWYTTIRWPDFRAQIPRYLATLGPEYPKTLAEMVERAQEITSIEGGGGGPNPTRWTLLEDEERSGTLDQPSYVTMRDHGLPLVRGIVEGLFAEHGLDAIVYPTSTTRPGLVAGGGGGGGPSATNIANLAGFPDLIVPAGFTSDRLPVGISFFGTAFSEPRLLALGYAFEQATRARRDPVHTPALSGERIGG